MVVINKLIAVIFLIASIGGAAEITLSVNRNDLTVQDQLQASVTLEGDRQLSSFPQLTNVDAFDVQNGGTSSQVQFINGRISSKKVFNFYLYPKKEGIFVIGPAVIEQGGSKYQSNTVKIKISKAAEVAPVNRPYYIEASVDNKRPFIGQQIIYTFKFYRRGIAVSNANVEFPSFEDFWQEQMGKQREYETIINGVRFVVTEIKYALFPTKVGKLRLDETVLKALVTQGGARGGSLFDSFFSGVPSKQVRMQAPAIEIEARALPEEGKPNNFVGPVGLFEVEGKLSKNRIKVGESTTLTVTIIGDGNAKDVSLPKIDLAQFKTYEDKPQSSMNVVDGSLVGSKVLTVALVPLKEGRYQLDDLSFDYFNPHSGEYESKKLSGLVLEVLPGSGEEQIDHVSGVVPESKKAIKIVGEDLRPIKRDIALFDREASRGLKATVLAILLLMPLFYLVLRGAKRRRDRLASDHGLVRRGLAFKQFSRAYGKLRLEEGMVEKASQILRQFLGDKLNIDGLALTPRDVERFEISIELQKDVKEFLQQCEMGVYGGFRLAPKDYKGFKERLYRLVKRCDKEIS